MRHVSARSLVFSKIFFRRRQWFSVVQYVADRSTTAGILFRSGRCTQSPRLEEKSERRCFIRAQLQRQEKGEEEINNSE